jgi:hypothetical protein
MTASAPSDLLAEGGADLRTLPSDLDLVGLLRTANAERPKQAWTFYLDPSDRSAPTLTVGLNGRVGFVQWWNGKKTVRPSMVTTTGSYVDYWNGGHHFQCDAGEEVPAEYVFAVVAEFVATHRRPMCLRWQNAAA